MDDYRLQMIKRICTCALLFLIVTVLGCAGLSGPSRWCSGQLDRRITRLSVEEFAMPVHTPYDGTNSLKDAYLVGYRSGIEDGISVKGSRRHLLHFEWKTEEQWAGIVGWKQGRDDVTDKVKGIVELFVTEFVAVFSNRNQEATFYYSNGQLRSLTDFATDSTGGLWRTRYVVWYENGQMEEEQRFDKQEYRNGWTRRWYENGNLREVEMWRRGGVNGRCEGFYPNGQKMYSLTCSDSIPVGEASVWNGDGQLISRGVFRDGKWTETLCSTGYIIGVPKQEVTQYSNCIVTCPRYHFSVQIDPAGPVAARYWRFLNQSENETNPIVEIRDWAGELVVLTGNCATNGTHYYLVKDGSSWRVDGKGEWRRPSPDSYEFYTTRVK